MDWPILSGVPEDTRRRVLGTARLRRFARNEVVFHEGDPADTFHLIAKGRFAVKVSTSLGDTAMLAVLGKGDFFGELSLLGAHIRSATVVALEPGETLAIHREAFDEILREHPSVQGFLVEVLGAQVRRLSGQVMEALFLPADRRVLKRLAGLVAAYGSDGDGDGFVEIPLTQDDLATLAGTSRATVNRVLRDAEKAGLVKIGRKRVTVLDPAAVRAQAERL
jgi:CRP/FNR family transcriptional regulator, cyclic AMP receptor protein